MRFDNQLRYAEDIVKTYEGDEPLHLWLKSYFRDHKQMGSRDRRQLSNLVYGFYRLGHAVRHMSLKERLLLGSYLSHEKGELLEYFRPDWKEGSLEEKVGWTGFNPEEIFPWKDQLSDSIDHRAFCLSFLRQPDLFLRIRPGFQEMVLDKAGAEGFISPATLRLSNGVKVEELFTPDVEVVVQDYSSQRIGALLVDEVPRRYWDACAASGGKTLLVFDRYPSVEITVSDLRESILRNLEQRFQRAGIKQYTSMTADLQKPGTGPMRKPFDLVLADVPCTGSGTWSRTPEELYFFDPAKIDVYSERQRKIMDNILPKIQGGGRLVYITCSVFRKENEEMLQYLQGRRGMTVEEGGPIIGYADRADTMFAARLRP